jgi:cytochrome c biogenesis protein CcdA/glutaredoxin
MRRHWIVVSLLMTVLLVLLLGLLGGRVVSAQDSATGEPDKPVVRFFLFYSPTCPHCHEVMENYLPTVYEKYGTQVEYQYIDIAADSETYITMLRLETKLGVPEDALGGVPALVIGDKVMVGGAEIPAKLEGYIDEYLAQGGVDFPSLEDLPEVVLPTPEPSVQILIFLDATHSDFEELSSLMTSLVQAFPDQLQPYVMDVTVEENSSRLAELHAALSVSAAAPGTPEVLIDRRLLIGIQEIRSELPGLIDQYLVQGGSTIPPWEELVGSGPSETITPEPEGTEAAPRAIYVAYFEQAGCQECARTTYDLKVVQEQYPQLVLESFSIEEAENKALNEWLSDKYGVPEEERLSTPMVFVGDDVLIGTDANLSNLLTVVTKYAETGTERTWDDFDPKEGEKGIVDRFLSFGVLTVLGAGLIDGLNPCAFATLVFFISYLAFTGRRGRDILFVGISFTLGVFLTYLLVGVGLLKVVQSLSFFTALGRWVYLLTALLCLVLAILTFRDYFKAREGQATDMTLKLPLSLRRRINKVIRESAQVRAFVAMAFVTGFIVSLLELACTGQVYLPTIVYVMSQPDLATQAFLYLLLYCLMFILPLVVVFALSYFGASSEQLGQFINRRTSTIKFITGLLFVALALWMTWTLAPLFGIHSPWNWVLMGAVLVVILIAVVVWHYVDERKPSKPVARRRRRRA